MIFVIFQKECFRNRSQGAGNNNADEGQNPKCRLPISLNTKLYTHYLYRNRVYKPKQ